MLTELHIQNWVTIQELHLDFKNGTTVITGETGTGKSIIIDAIELALGGRATSDMVRVGQEKADISISFDIQQLSAVQQWLKNYGLEDANECIVRRTLHRDGRSRSFINGLPTTLQLLRELSESLVQIQGQHEHQSLLKTDNQRGLLDHYAKHGPLLDEVLTLAEEWHALQREMSVLRQWTEQRQTQEAFLKYQLNELQTLNLTQDEFTRLDLEHKQLAHSEELIQQLNHALNHLTDNEERNAIYYLNQALQALETIESVDPKIAAWSTSLKHTIIQLGDTEDDLRRYLDHTEVNPERLQWLEQRISAWFNLARKHKVAPDELFDLQKKFLVECNELANSGARLAELASRRDILESQYAAAAKKLSLSRRQAADLLAQEITQLIVTLSLPHAEFYIQLEPLPEAHGPSPFGLEKIIFLLKTNAGQPLQPLAKIASGGELSRIGLAIYLASAGQHGTPALIFDEIDVGIGGSTAEIVGKLLRHLGKTHQVLCITHQPQVAAQGHHHLCVKKMLDENTAVTQIHYLSAAEKIQELARMLGGVEITQKTLAHAAELIEMNSAS